MASVLAKKNLVSMLLISLLVLSLAGMMMDVVAVFLVLYTLFHGILIIAPIGLFMLIAIEHGVSHRLIALSIGACASGVLVYFDFWLWIFSPDMGLYFSVLVNLVIVILYIMKHQKMRKMEEVQEWGWVVGLWLSYSLFILSMGLAPFGIEDVLTNVAQRFNPKLPMDNQLPFIFAEQIAAGKILTPMIGDWLSSDRPPLQTAYYLATGVVMLEHNDLHYQVSTTLLQSLWITALYSLLRISNVKPIAILLVLTVTMFSGFAIVHELFTWPKLLPVFFILLIVGVVFDKNIQWLVYWQTGALVGALAAFALLCHGGSIFALLGIVLGLLFYRQIPKPTFILVAIIAELILVLFWSFYQVNVDPPGNRLLKWHLAGMVSINDFTLWQALIDGYSNVDAQTILMNKFSNILTLFGDVNQWTIGLVQSVFGFTSIDERVSLSQIQFFTLVASWGIFPLALFVLFFRKEVNASSEYILGKKFLVMAISSILCWCILMFGPEATVIHQGTLALLVMLFCGSILISCAFSVKFAIFLSVIHFLIVYHLYFSYGWYFDSVEPNLSLFVLSVISFVLTLKTVLALGLNSLFN